jgi:hypothetical protein
MTDLSKNANIRPGNMDFLKNAKAQQASMESN